MAAPAHMVDVAFALQASTPALPRSHRRALAHALEATLPWLAWPAAGEARPAVHRLTLACGAGGQALLARRTRLVLRVPRERVEQTLALCGRTLALEDCVVQVGAGHVREILPWGTVYAHLVASDAAHGAHDETGFLDDARQQLRALGVGGRTICGRAHTEDGGALRGHSLMVDGLGAVESLRLMEHGLGPHRRLGCGVFVPHRSAAAVGEPP